MRPVDSDAVDGARTLLDKVWDEHVVVPETDDTPAVLYIDLHLIHEVTSPQAFTALRERGLTVSRPDLTLATIDHSVPTSPAAWDAGPGRVVDQCVDLGPGLSVHAGETGVPGGWRRRY